LGGGSSSTILQSDSVLRNTDEAPTTELQRRTRNVVQDSIALDESTALMNSAARELELAPSHPRIINNNTPAGTFSSEYVTQAESAMDAAYEDRAVILAQARRILGESQQVLGRRRATGSVPVASMATQAPQESSSLTADSFPSNGSLEPEMAQRELTTLNVMEPVPSSSPLLSQEEAVNQTLPTEDCTATKDKGKGRAVTVETCEED